jgi:hypothetical protein
MFVMRLDWGCGVFRGDKHLKALLQLMAAAVNAKDLVYYTFNDKKLAEEIKEMHSLLQEHNVTVGTPLHSSANSCNPYLYRTTLQIAFEVRI